MGDSHSRLFAGIPGAVCIHIGPITMRRMAYQKDSLMQDTVTSLMTGTPFSEYVRGICTTSPGNPVDVIAFSFGEGDVRCFITKTAETLKMDVDAYLSDLVDNCLKRLAAFEMHGARCAILSIPPPAVYKRAFVPNWPPQGSDAERSSWTKKINSMLAARSPAYGILFIDIYSEYAGPDGMLPLEVSDRRVHIADKTRLTALLTKMKLI